MQVAAIREGPGGGFVDDLFSHVIQFTPMPGDEHSSDDVNKARASLQLAFSVLGQIGALTMGVIAAALVAGLWLDRTFSTRPLFTVLLMLGSFPVTYYVIYRIALNAVGKIQPVAGKAPRREEDTRRDDNDP